MPNRDFPNHRPVPPGPDLVDPLIAPGLQRNPADTLAVKVLEARSRAVPQVGDVGKALLTVRRVLSDAGKAAVHPVPGTAGGHRRVFAEQVAGDVGRVLPPTGKGAAVAAAGGHLHLGDAPIGEDGHRLQTALAAEVGAVGTGVGCCGIGVGC